MERETSYGFGRTVSLGFEAAVGRVKEALGQEGFGIVSDIDISAAFREKLGIEFRPYRILGACNPAMAYLALGAEIDLGVMLPCNVAIYVDEEGRTMVMAMHPEKALPVIGNPALAELAAEVHRLLARALAVV
jgi:uncharacterized protein (DUF302 family)